MACHEIHHAHRIDRNLLHIPWKLGPNQPGGPGESSDWHCCGRPNLSRGRRTLRHDGVDAGDKAGREQMHRPVLRRRHKTLRLPRKSFPQRLLHPGLRKHDHDARLRRDPRRGLLCLPPSRTNNGTLTSTPSSCRMTRSKAAVTGSKRSGFLRFRFTRGGPSWITVRSNGRPGEGSTKSRSRSIIS